MVQNDYGLPNKGIEMQDISVKVKNKVLVFMLLRDIVKVKAERILDV